MALDTRDYWKRKWNKKSAYVEQADFRVGVADLKRKRYRQEWRRTIIKCVVILFCLFALGHALKFLLRG